MWKKIKNQKAAEEEKTAGKKTENSEDNWFYSPETAKGFGLQGSTDHLPTQGHIFFF